MLRIIFPNGMILSMHICIDSDGVVIGLNDGVDDIGEANVPYNRFLRGTAGVDHQIVEYEAHGYDNSRNQQGNPSARKAHGP